MNDVSSVVRISKKEATELVMDYGINLDLCPDKPEDTDMEKKPFAGDRQIRLSETVSGAPNTIPTSFLDEIVYLRSEELTENICSCLSEKKLLYSIPRGIVLTGGGASILNQDALIHIRSGLDTRIGYPLGFDEIPDAIRKPEWTAVTGILKYAFAHRRFNRKAFGDPTENNSLPAAIIRFFKEYVL